MLMQSQKNNSQSSLGLEGMFDNLDAQTYLGYPQQLQKSNSMGRQGAPTQVNSSGNMASPYQQAPLDKAKQEQLMKMRLQIMQQQMLQRQPPQLQQLPPMPQLMVPPYQQNRMLPNLGFDSGSIGQPPNSALNMMYSDNRRPGPNTGSLSLQMSDLGGPSQPNSGPPFNTSAPGSSTNVPQATAGMQKAPMRLTQAQVSQLQNDIFLMSLNDFMNRKGSPITLPPVVSNKKVNLYALQVLSRRMGGPTAVLRQLQMLNQPSSQFTEWSTICQKLGLFENIDVANNVIAKHQVEKTLGACYLQFIHPYEQYALTEEGQRDLQARKVQIQRQLVARMQQQQLQMQQQPQLSQSQSQQSTLGPNQNLNQSNNQGMNQSPQYSQQQPPQQSQNSLQYNSPSLMMNRPGSGPPQMSSQAMKNRMPGAGPEMSQSPAVSQKGQFQSPTITNLSPHPSMMPTPNLMSNPSPSMANANPLRKLSQQSSAHNSPALIQSPYMPNQGSRSSSVQHQKPLLQQSVVATESSSNSAPASAEQEVAPGNPNTVKKYTPMKKVVDSRGYFLKKISELGDKIEVLKPVYLFAPELGALNLHALTMSLKNYSSSNEGEAFSALNTLLVTTADDNFLFNLSEAPELISALVELGKKILTRITVENHQSQDFFDIKNPVDNPIDAIFNKYVSSLDMQGEDVAFVVDSLTGDLVVDEDSDMDMDEIFTPVPSQPDSESSVESPPKIDSCGIPDYMSAMHLFRKENKHHFSKLQTKGPLDEQVFLVDSLITVSMTLRNLSLSEDSAGVMPKSESLRKLVFEIVKQVATKPDAFVFERKRLCLLKDCLVILNTHGSHIELQSLEEAFLLFLLVSAFGPKLDDDEHDPTNSFALINASLEHYTYLPFAVDVFTKFLVREPKNRAYFQAVFCGTLNITSSATNPGSDSVTILREDHQETKKLLTAYFGGDLTKLKQGVLLTRAFKLFMSSIPWNVSGVEFTRTTLSYLPSILQALFGAKLLIDLVSSDEINVTLSRVLLLWLSTNIQPLVLNFTKSVFVLIAESIKVMHTTAEQKIGVFVSIRALIVINSLFANAVKLQTACEEGEIEDIGPVLDQIEPLRSLYRIQVDSDFLLNNLNESGIEPDLSEQILRLRGLMGVLKGH